MTTLSVGQIQPPHEVRDEEKLEIIAASMRETGWQGRPVLVIERSDYYQALTGSHRYAAAELAEIDSIPVVIVNTELLEEAGYTITELCYSDTEEVASILSEIGDVPAAELAQQEVIHESNEYKVA